MIRNMGTLDRGIRVLVVAPAAIAVALIVGAGTVGGIILLVVAGIMLATAAAGFCPAYTVVGISTHAARTATRRPWHPARPHLVTALPGS